MQVVKGGGAARQFFFFAKESVGSQNIYICYAFLMAVISSRNFLG